MRWFSWLRRKSRWVRVEDYWPPHSHCVLVRVKGEELAALGVYIESWGPGTLPFWKVIGRGCDSLKVTHWMEIPPFKD